MLSERVKEHWFVSIFGLCAVVAAATWKAEYEVLVAPRDFEIARLERELVNPRASSHQGLVKCLPETALLERTSVTTDDGVCTLYLDEVKAAEAVISIMVLNGAPTRLQNLKPGSRLSVASSGAYYYFDLLRFRGNTIDIVGFKGPGGPL